MPTEKVDGRQHRWRDHTIARRHELLDSTLIAIRRHGHDIGVKDIASASGVATSVLYKHFTNKKGLADAAMARYVDTVLLPRIHDAIAEDLDEYHLTRAVISAYVTTVATDPEVYIYVRANNAVGGNQDIVTASEGLIAELLATVVDDRFRQRGFAKTGSMPIAFAMVGAVRLASHWWIFDQTMTADKIVDYLTMMVWGGIAGIAHAEGSTATFTSQPHSLDDTETGPPDR